MMVDMEKYDDGKSMGIDGLSAFGTFIHGWIARHQQVTCTTQLWFRVTPTSKSPGTTKAKK